MEARHLDDNPDNNNLDNLVYGTRTENLLDAIRNGKLINPRGQDHPMSKLTDKQVLEIRRRYKRGCVSQQSLADEFGVSQVMIGNITRGKRKMARKF